MTSPAVLHGFVGEEIAVIGGTKNCATTAQNAADGFFREFLGALGPDESIKAVADADDASCHGRRWQSEQRRE
jgi:hypothetical protein